MGYRHPDPEIQDDEAKWGCTIYCTIPHCCTRAVQYVRDEARCDDHIMDERDFR